MRVWIEISIRHIVPSLPLFHPLMRVWIEIYSFPPKIPPTLCVSPSYEGVDWNYNSTGWRRLSRFHPLMRVWIEIWVRDYVSFELRLFHPLMRVWIEILVGVVCKLYRLVSPSYEGVDWNIMTNRPDFIKSFVSPSYEGVDWNECWIKKWAW